MIVLRQEHEMGVTGICCGDDDDDDDHAASKNKKKKLEEGALVEVRMTEMGLRGSWHPAVVTAVKPGKRVVVYEELVSEHDSRHKLKETIPVGRGADGLHLLWSASSSSSSSPPSRQQQQQFGNNRNKKKKKKRRILLRPRPPVLLSSLENVSWSKKKKGLWVDAFWRDAWWEGILAEDLDFLSEEEEEKKKTTASEEEKKTTMAAQQQAMVYFPDEGGLEMCFIKDLRVRQEWDEDTGNWSLKGCTKLLPEQLRQQQLPFLGFTDVKISMKEQKRGGKECRSAAPAADGRRRRTRRRQIRMAPPSPAATADSPPDPSPAYCLSKLLQGLEAVRSEEEAAEAKEEEVAVADSNLLAARKEQEDSCNRQTTIQLFAAAEGTQETTAPTAMPFCCNGKSNHDGEEEAEKEGQEGEGEEGGEEAEDPGSLVPPDLGSLEEKNPPAMESRVLQEVGWKSSAPEVEEEEEEAQCLEEEEEEKMAIAAAATSAKTSPEQQQQHHQHHQVLNPESSLEKTSSEIAALNPVEGMMMPIMPFCSEQDEFTRGTEQEALCWEALCSTHAEEEEAEEQEEEEEEEAEAAAAADDDETLGMLLIEHRAQIRKPRVMNHGKEPAGMRSENIRDAMVLRNRQCTKLDVHRESEHGEEKKKKKFCCGRKRAFNHHSCCCCNNNHLIVTEPCRSKKKRWRSAYEESTALPCLPPPPHKEPGFVGKKLGVSSSSSSSSACKVFFSSSSSSVHERRTRCKKSKTGVQGGGCRMEVLLSQPAAEGDPCTQCLSGGDLAGKSFCSTKKNTLSWLIDAGILQTDQKLRYMHRRKELGVGGWVTTEGVLCGCCNNVVNLSTFEMHCGSRLHRPCANIFVEDGNKSIATLQMEALKKQMSAAAAAVRRTSCHRSFHKGNHNNNNTYYHSRRGNSQSVKQITSDVNDDTCGICGDGGMLICCDHCPSTFHLKCMELTVVPEEDWYCPNCRCAICGQKQFNGSHDTFDETSVLFCDQCECGFHVKCLYMRGMLKMEEYPQDSWFCGSSCERIYRGLRGLVGTDNSLGKGFSWTLLRSQDDNPPDPNLMDLDNKELLAEQNMKLSIALSVMRECFRPMIDPCTKVDVIAHALYNRGSDVNRLNYRGFYTMILEKGDELISVAAIRVHGAVLAEMPLIGTRFQYRRQGMCRRLMHAIEQMLRTLGVETLVLPAVPELLETWIGAFGFQPMDTFPKQTLIELNLMTFPGTALLHKSLARLQPIADKKTKIQRGIKESRQLAILKGSGLSRGARFTQSSASAHIGVLQFVAGKKASDEVVLQGTEEIPGTEFPVTESDTVMLESSCVGDDEHDDDEQVVPAQSSAAAANLDSPLVAEATIRELADSLMDEYVQRVLEQVIDSDKEFSSSKLGSDVQESRPRCHEGDDGSEGEPSLQRHQHRGFQQNRHPEKESVVQKREEDDAYYRTKVVVATTRYKRQVKTSRWVADAMKKLRGHSSMRTACASPVQKTRLCNTDLCKPIIPSLSEDKHPLTAAEEALPVNLQCMVESSKIDAGRN